MIQKTSLNEVSFWSQFRNFLKNYSVEFFDLSFNNNHNFFEKRDFLIF